MPALSPTADAVAALVLAGALSVGLTPIAIRLAHRTGMLDHPSGHKGHARATPLLGGMSVIMALVATVAVFAPSGWLLPCILLAVLLGIGTIDDRVGLSPQLRVVVTAAAAAALSLGSLGWTVFDQGVLDLLITVAFVLAAVNAINLMDNLDGAAATVIGVTGLVLGAFDLAQGATGAAVLGFALAGSCAGFLVFNLRRPARIFLGDGGSMPLGMALALLIMGTPGPMSEPGGGALGLGLILVVVLLVGLPAFDTALVIRSRVRRSVSVLTGGRDHLTHRLLPVLGSPQRVALALAITQALILLLAIGVYQLDESVAIPVTVAIMALAALAIERLDGRLQMNQSRWRLGSGFSRTSTTRERS
ncbi:MAG TPA: MraY family glycosyltransferase [Solirubrobacterales bacterium]|nr:MraY family glycosyltransferase [Solirubrobacterales bacterium]